MFVQEARIRAQDCLAVGAGHHRPGRRDLIHPERGDCVRVLLGRAGGCGDAAERCPHPGEGLIDRARLRQVHPGDPEVVDVVEPALRQFATFDRPCQLDVSHDLLRYRTIQIWSMFASPAANIRSRYTSGMVDVSRLGLFVAAAIALLLMPGPAVLYIVTRSVERGRVAGLVSVLGICTGTLVHVVAATLGLSALLVSSALAFGIVRYVGALYLIVLGIRTLLRREPRPTDVGVVTADLRRVFAQGVIVNVLNPHTAVFFFAFLPQFVDTSSGHVPGQMLTLGLLFVALSATTDSGWAIAAGTAGDWIRQHRRFAAGQRYVTGGALIGLGAASVFAGSGRK